jgi:hypothetical protein
MLSACYTGFCQPIRANPEATKASVAAANTAKL